MFGGFCRASPGQLLSMITIGFGHAPFPLDVLRWVEGHEDPSTAHRSAIFRFAVRVKSMSHKFAGGAIHGFSLSIQTPWTVRFCSEEPWFIVGAHLGQGLNALFHLHGHAMMHCDIKEPNMMIKSSDFKQPHICLIDFGIARAMADDSTETCGTPGYIPPETWSTGRQM